MNYSLLESPRPLTWALPRLCVLSFFFFFLSMRIREWWSYFPSITPTPCVFECISSATTANSISSANHIPLNCKDGEERGAEERRGGGGGETWGWGARWALNTLSLWLSGGKKIFKRGYVHWKVSACWILKYLWHHCFFFLPPLLCVYKLQAVTQLFPWQYLSVWGIH